VIKADAETRRGRAGVHRAGRSRNRADAPPKPPNSIPTSVASFVAFTHASEARSEGGVFDAAAK
jgi:hypothetical protein